MGWRRTASLVSLAALLWCVCAGGAWAQEGSPVESIPPVEQAVAPFNWVAWSLLATGGVFLGVSVYFNGEGYGSLLDVQRASIAGDARARQEAIDEVRFHQAVTGTTLGLGLTALGSGLTLLLIDALREQPSGAQVGYGWAPGGGVVTMGAAF